MKNQIIEANEILPIIKYGDPILRKKVSDIVDFTDLPQMVTKMFNTMNKESGIGLAANQVGWSLNLLILDTSTIEEEDKGETYIFVNSKITDSIGAIILEEGCLSVPDIRAEIERPATIKLQYQDLDQNFHERTFTGLVSRIIQHELDHLKGKFFVDYLSPAKRLLINKRLMEISKNGRPSTGIIL